MRRFTSNPSRQLRQAITRVFKYLKDSSSTSGWVFLLGGGGISLASKKQTCIIGSTIESEFVALAVLVQELKDRICEHEVLQLQEAWTWLS
ncbi:hypothetical protein Tco_0068710, partial [Tanacetum coccineum]